MQVILFSSRMGQPRQLQLGLRHLVLVGLAGAGLMVIGALSLYWFTLNHANKIDLPWVHDLVRTARHEEVKKHDEFVKNNLDAMARQLGEMQAQLVKLDALGERVSGLAGVKAADFRAGEKPGRGGAEPTAAKTLTLNDFQRELAKLSRGVDNQTDLLSVVESELFRARLAAKKLPTILPVNATYNASGFGWRIDPITGQGAQHEGIDFIAPTGTPIVSAADGVVIAAEWHHSYGQMIEIDHGNDLISRYAHASTMLVKPGNLVKRGQKIAEVGSTGRSTGAHLHFEVRLKGAAQDPAKFLLTAASPAPGAPLAMAPATSKPASSPSAKPASTAK